jgi:16S rRNA (uracil1498-N3)-methyltransferase
MHVFFTENIDHHTALLSAVESQHCIRVLRLGKGDEVKVLDGKGGFYTARITIADTRQCQLEITGKLPASTRGYNIHIAIAPTKNIDRFEWFIEKSVEIGIDTITPLLCQRSERRVLKTERLQKLIVATIKQAMIPSLPVLNELADYKTFVSNLSGYASNRYIAHCEETDKKQLKSLVVPQSDIIILIGPEGDFSPSEISLALEHGFEAVTFGNNRLRTETAGIFACNIVHAIND